MGKVRSRIFVTCARKDSAQVAVWILIGGSTAERSRTSVPFAESDLPHPVTSTTTEWLTTRCGFLCLPNLATHRLNIFLWIAGQLIERKVSCWFSGETSQVPALRQIFSDPRRSEKSSVRSQRILAVHLSRVPPRLLKADQSPKSLAPPLWYEQ